jgi:hypothetical protein
VDQFIRAAATSARQDYVDAISHRKRLEANAKARIDGLKAVRSFLDEKALAKVVRYESHLTRQLRAALHEIHRLQAERAKIAIPPNTIIGVEIPGRSLVCEMA